MNVLPVKKKKHDKDRKSKKKILQENPETSK